METTKLDYLSKYLDSYDEIRMACAEPQFKVPTVEFNIRNLQMPFDSTDYDYLNQDSINVFAVQDQTVTGSRRSISKTMIEPGIKMQQPFLMMGYCVYAYADPWSYAIPGNKFGTRAMIDALGTTPASPLNLRNVAALLNRLYSDNNPLAELRTACPSVFTHGLAAWEAIFAFMRAFRCEVTCPGSAFTILSDEALSDIGNCCVMPEWQGFSSSQGDWSVHVREMNDRLRTITLPNNLGDIGYFIPVNCEQAADGEIAPYRLQPVDVSYGAGKDLGAIEQWYRFATPVPLMPDNEIKFKLTREAGDQDYHTMLLNSGLVRDCFSNVTSLAGTFPINEAALGVDVDGGIATTSIFPHGEVRLGIGIKGFYLRHEICRAMCNGIVGKTPEVARGLMAGTCGTPYNGYLGAVQHSESDRQVVTGPIGR